MLKINLRSRLLFNHRAARHRVAILIRMRGLIDIDHALDAPRGDWSISGVVRQIFF